MLMIMENKNAKNLFHTDIVQLVERKSENGSIDARME